MVAAAAGRTPRDNYWGDAAEEEEGERRLPATSTVTTTKPRTEEEAAAARDLEKRVQAIEQLEGERRLAALPMAAKVGGSKRVAERGREREQAR